MVIRRQKLFLSIVAVLVTAVSATAAVGDAVCSFPLTRLFVQTPQSPSHVACVDASGGILPLCLMNCDCRELQNPSNSDVAWGVCVETSPSSTCLNPAAPSTRHQCRRTDSPVPESPLPKVQPLQASALSVNATTPSIVKETTPVPTVMPTSTTSSAASSSDTDRNTVIIIVACVVAIFAIVVVVAIVRADRNRDTAKDGPSTPKEGDFNEFTGTDPTPHTTIKPHIHRPSLAYSERTTRTTVASHGRDSGNKRDDSDDEDTDDVAMLESYGQPRAFNGETFVSVVDFGDSTRSLEVDTFGRSDTYSRSDTTVSSAYWRNDSDDSMLETNTNVWSFTDAQEPPEKS